MVYKGIDQRFILSDQTIMIKIAGIDTFFTVSLYDMCLKFHYANQG